MILSQVLKGQIINNGQRQQPIITQSSRSRENEALTQTKINEIINITDRELKKQSDILQRLENNDNRRMNEHLNTSPLLNIKQEQIRETRQSRGSLENKKKNKFNEREAMNFYNDRDVQRELAKSFNLADDDNNDDENEYYKKIINDLHERDEKQKHEREERKKIYTSPSLSPWINELQQKVDDYNKAEKEEEEKKQQLTRGRSIGVDRLIDDNGVMITLRKNGINNDFNETVYFGINNEQRKKLKKTLLYDHAGTKKTIEELNKIYENSGNRDALREIHKRNYGENPNKDWPTGKLLKKLAEKAIDKNYNENRTPRKT